MSAEFGQGKRIKCCQHATCRVQPPRNAPEMQPPCARATPACTSTPLPPSHIRRPEESWRHCWAGLTLGSSPRPPHCCLPASSLLASHSLSARRCRQLRRTCGAVWHVRVRVVGLAVRARNLVFHTYSLPARASSAPCYFTHYAGKQKKWQHFGMRGGRTGACNYAACPHPRPVRLQQRLGVGDPPCRPLRN